MKKAVRRILSVALLVMILGSLISCSTVEEDQNAPDPNELNPEEKLLVDSFINVLFARKTNTDIDKIKDYDMPTLRVTAIGNRLDYTDKEGELEGGILVKIQIQAKSLKDGSKTYRNAFYFAIKGCQNETYKSKYDTWKILKEHVSPKVYVPGYTTSPECWCIVGDLFLLYDNQVEVGYPYDGMSVVKINQALQRHWESMGLL